MVEIEQTIDSREAAAMVEKEHKFLMRDIRRYIKQIIDGNEKNFTECKIAPSEFFKKSEYKDSTGRTLPCYRITKKGCEFIAHKLTGTKGTIFTARYINRFHEMQDTIAGRTEECKIPWFIRQFEGRYIILERDFIQITGVDIRKHKLFYREECFRGGLDYNGWGWHTTINKEAFRKKYGFDYGDDKCMIYFYLRGAVKALKILSDDFETKLRNGAYKMIMDGIEKVQSPKIKKISLQNQNTMLDIEENRQNVPVQINIICGQNYR